MNQYLYLIRAISNKGKACEYIVGWFTTADRAIEHVKKNMLGFVTTSFPKDGVARYELFYLSAGNRGHEIMVDMPAM